MQHKSRLPLPLKISVIIFSGFLLALALIVMLDRSAAAELFYPVYTLTDDLQRKLVKNEEECIDLEIQILNRELKHLQALESHGSDTTETLKKIERQLTFLQPKIEYILSNDELQKDFIQLIALHNLQLTELANVPTEIQKPISSPHPIYDTKEENIQNDVNSQKPEEENVLKDIENHLKSIEEKMTLQNIPQNTPPPPAKENSKNNGKKK